MKQGNDRARRMQREQPAVSMGQCAEWARTAMSGRSTVGTVGGQLTHRKCAHSDVRAKRTRRDERAVHMG
jgi:hypothetical protein